MGALHDLCGLAPNSIACIYFNTILFVANPCYFGSSLSSSTFLVTSMSVGLIVSFPTFSIPDPNQFWPIYHWTFPSNEVHGCHFYYHIIFCFVRMYGCLIHSGRLSVYLLQVLRRLSAIAILHNCGSRRCNRSSPSLYSSLSSPLLFPN